MGGETEAHFSDRPGEEARTELLSPDCITQVSTCAAKIHFIRHTAIRCSCAWLSRAFLCLLYAKHITGLVFFSVSPVHVELFLELVCDWHLRWKGKGKRQLDLFRKLYVPNAFSVFPQFNPVALKLYPLCTSLRCSQWALSLESTPQTSMWRW